MAWKATMTARRLLHLVVPGSKDFFQRMTPENWTWPARLLSLSVHIPVLAGIAAVPRRPAYWIDKLVGAAAPLHRTGLLKNAGSLSSAD
jgi:hypothetical protein